MNTSIATTMVIFKYLAKCVNLCNTVSGMISISFTKTHTIILYMPNIKTYLSGIRGSINNLL